MKSKETDKEILDWKFENEIDETVKAQIELLLNYVVKVVKNEEERQNRYLIPLKCLLCYAKNSGLQDILKMETAQEREYTSLLKKQMGKSYTSVIRFIAFCRKALFLESEEINWEANVWYVEKLNVAPERYSLSSTIESFSFLDIQFPDNRAMLQKYMKYLFTVTNLNLGTIRIKHTYAKEFFKFLEEKGEVITNIDVHSVKEYFDRLSMQSISPQSCNNKIKEIAAFIQYLQVTDQMAQFIIPVSLYKKKSFPKNQDIKDLDKKLDLLMIHLSEFPEQLRIMILILLYTGIDKGKLFLLRNADFYYENDDNWMIVPDENRSVPISYVLHWLVLKYAEKNHISVDSLLFLNKGRKYTARSFQDAIMEHCMKSGILDGEYIFNLNSASDL